LFVPLEPYKHESSKPHGESEEKMKSYKCAYCDRKFELSDNAAPRTRDGQNVCEMCIVEME
ncbi:MAG TPA: hypothetical protein VFH25_00510, partial [Nitrososphaeraceae archaeon]|nr:hypothetical protein [Nitrososphaeraceae archaeon]